MQRSYLYRVFYDEVTRCFKNGSILVLKIRIGRYSRTLFQTKIFSKWGRVRLYWKLLIYFKWNIPFLSLFLLQDDILNRNFVLHEAENFVRKKISLILTVACLKSQYVQRAVKCKLAQNDIPYRRRNEKSLDADKFQIAFLFLV